MKTTWTDKVTFPSFPSLSENIQTEVVIVGGGLCGILTAYLLSKEGKTVTLIEKEDFFTSVTAYTTAFLTYVIDTSVDDLISMFGKKKAKLVWDSHKDAIDLIESIVKKEKIDCEFTRCPEYNFASSSDQTDGLKAKQKSAKQIGYDLPFQTKQLPFQHYGYLFIPDQAKFHPLKFLSSLLEILKKNGVQIFTNTEAIEVTGEKPVVKTKKGTIEANYVILATYFPLNNPIQLFARKGMYISYVYEYEIPTDSLEDGLYLDEENPYHYFRVDTIGKKKRLIMGGEDHREELPVDPKKHFIALDTYTQTILPTIPTKEKRKWDGPILEPFDGLAFIGRYSKNPRYLVSTGFSGNGMTYSAIAAKLCTDLILGQKNEYEEIYNPRRVPTVSQLLTKGRDYTEEFMGGAVKNFFQRK